ncbi:MAG: hypothetical protein AB7V62_09585 [Thermoleophilia bacterium]
MLRRALPLAATALAACALTAVAVPKAGAPVTRVPVVVEGDAASWNQAKGTIALAEATTLGPAPKKAKKAVRSARRVTVVLGPGTVLVGEDEEGLREVLERADMFAALDAAEEDVVVEAAGRLALPAPRRARTAGPTVLTARKVIVLLPPLDGDDPYGEDLDGLPEDPPVDEEPVIDPDDPDLDEDAGLDP